MLELLWLEKISRLSSSLPITLNNVGNGCNPSHLFERCHRIPPRFDNRAMASNITRHQGILGNETDLKICQQTNHDEHYQARQLLPLPSSSPVFLPDRRETGDTVSQPACRSCIHVLLSTSSGESRRNNGKFTHFPSLKPPRRTTRKLLVPMQWLLAADVLFDRPPARANFGGLG